MLIHTWGPIKPFRLSFNLKPLEINLRVTLLWLQESVSFIHILYSQLLPRLHVLKESKRRSRNHPTDDAGHRAPTSPTRHTLGHYFRGTKNYNLSQVDKEGQAGVEDGDSSWG